MRYRELFNTHIIYFRILDELGKGIMLKPQLEQYIITLCNYSSSNFNKILKLLADSKLVTIERTKTASIVTLTCPSLAMLRDKESSKKVSTSSIRTNANFQKSIVKNEYIIATYLPLYNSYTELIGAIKEGNLINKLGDNLDVAQAILERSEGVYIQNMQLEVDYIIAMQNNKIAQLKNNTLNKMIADKKDCSLNNLQARHMYITSCDSDVQIAYLEVSKPINLEKLKADMKMLSNCTQFIQADTITVDIVVDSNRLIPVNSVVREWERKYIHTLSIPKEQLTINVVSLDITNKYLKGINISL